jgi:hypothetical protein
MDRTVTFKREEISGHDPQMEFNTKTGTLIDRQLECGFGFDFDFDFDFEYLL